MISRIAPTPNGEIHWGNLMNFALTWAYVKKHQGTLWLRFDDIDLARCRESYAQGTRQLLEHMGIDWQHELTHQFERRDYYRDYLSQIPHYTCVCSRKEVQERSGDYHYDGHCRDRGFKYRAGKNAIRFLHPSNPAGDFILWRREDLPAYHLTSVCDDEDMRTTTIVRGKDLEESSHLQRELSRLLPSDPLSQVEFIHHRLLLDERGQKLAKNRRQGDLFKRVERGDSREKIWSQLGQYMQAPEIRSAEDILGLDLKEYST